MSYIKINIKRQLAEDGTIQQAVVSGFESDMADINNYELNILMHALSAPIIEGIISRQFTLNISQLDGQNLIG